MFKTRRKLLSQNFLKDSNLVDRLVRFSGILREDTVLEIGVGEGIITEKLLSVSGKVIALEFDRNLFSLVNKRLGKEKKLELLCKDFLGFDLPTESYKVFANIPFSVTGEIVKRLLFSNNPPVTCHLVVQKEAAEKFIFGKRKNSMLAVLFYPWFEIESVYQFKRDDFKPAPKVETSLLKITKRDKALIELKNTDQFRDFVVCKFTKSRSASQWSMEKWLNSYKADVCCRGFFIKWQSEQKKLIKIHRTRNDKNWRQKKDR